MAASVTASVGIGSNSAATTLETGTLTPTGSNKVIYALVGTGASSPADPTAVKYGGSGGESMTLMDSVRTIETFVKTSVWKLVNPSASSGTIHATFGGSNDERWIIGVAVQDADGTENTVAYATNPNNTAPTVNATSVSGDLVLGFLSVLNGSANNPQLTAGQTSILELESSTPGTGGIGVYESAGAEQATASGTSTTASWTLSTASSWGLHAFAVNEASAAPHTTTGALTGAGAAVAGTAAHRTLHATSGALTGAGASVVGTANRVKVHTSSGALTGAGAAVAGTAAHAAAEHATTGVLTGAGAAVAGTANRVKVHTSTGALTGAGAAVVGASANGAPGARTALDFPSNGDSPSAFVAMYLDGADLPNIQPLTLIFRVNIRQQAGYHTTFFHGRGDGTFIATQTYFGAHPYPDPPPSGTDHNWEISVEGQDDQIDETSGVETPVVYDTWFKQAVVAVDVSTETDIDFYYDLDTGLTSIINHLTTSGALTNDANSPKLFFGDAYWAQQNERLSGYLRGIQIYTAALSTTHIQALAEFENDADVLAYCSTNSITSLHYLNINPTASDVTDKSGNGRDMQWASGSTAGTFFLPGEFNATGALVGAGASVAGTANRVKVHATSGALTGAGAAVSGVASSAIEHATSGALVGAGAAVVGTANRVKLHPTTGVLAGSGATLEGVAERSTVGTHATTGELIGAGATIDGSATRLALHATSGALVGAGATVAGTSVHNTVHDAAGVLVGSVAQLVGLASLNGALPEEEFEPPPITQWDSMLAPIEKPNRKRKKNDSAIFLLLG